MDDQRTDREGGRITFRLRRLLIIVAVVVVSVWQWLRVVSLHDQAAQSERAANSLRRFINEPDTSTPEYASLKPEAIRQARFHKERIRRCQDAVWLPWVHFVPDVPTAEQYFRGAENN